MPDVGVLQLTIKDNSDSAATGLNNLADALSRVQTAAGNGLSLSGMSKTLNTFANAVSKNSKTLSNIGTFLNAVTSYSKAFKELEGIKFNAQPIKDLKDAVGEGIKIGQAGTQINNLRTALEGNWNTENATVASTALKTIAEGASGLKGTSLGTSAKGISAIAKALDEYATSCARLRDAVGAGSTDKIEMPTAATKGEAVAAGGTISEGTAEGMLAEKQAVAAAGTEVGHTAIDSIKEAVDSHSPSKEAMKIGEYIVEGLIQGILNKKSEIQAVMADLSKSMLGSLKESPVSAAGDWRGAMMGLNGDSGKKSKKSNDGIVSSMKQLSEAFQGFSNINSYVQGITDLNAAIEAGANSYHTLTYLATALTKVKTACSGFKLPDFSRLERLAQVLQENFNAENGLTRLAKGMEAMKAASAGFKMPSTKDIEKIINVMNGASATGASTPAGNGQFAAVDGLKQVEETVQQAETGLSVMNGELANTYKIIDGNDFDNGAKAFQETFEAFDSLRSSHALESGGSAELSVGVFDSLRQDAIEVEGTVSEAYDGVRYKALEAGEAFTEAGSAMNSIIPYGQDIEQTWEHINQLAVEAYNRWKDSRISGYGTIGSIRDLYASTDLRGEDAPGAALRGDKGYEAKIEARNQIAEITGMPIDEINKQLVQLGEDARKANANVRELVDSLNKPMDWGNLSQGIDRMQGIGTEAKSAEDSMRAFLENMGNGSAQGQQLQADNPELAQFKQTMEETGVAAKDFTSKLVDVDGELKSKKKDAAEASSGFLGLKETFNDLKKAMSTTVFGKLAKQFANIAKRMAIRAVIRQVTAAFKEGVENVYKYNEAIGGSFASDMDNAATSLLQMKNAIGAAVAPAIQAVIPYLNQLVSAFINAINYVNQFFSLLQGKSTWTRALPYATKAFEDQKKAAKGASSAMKDLLADWDELNIIQSESGGGGAGAATKDQTDYTQMFEEVSTFDNTVQGIASFVKDIIDFAKENLVEILGVVTAIKWGAKLAKFSSAFTGVLGDILSFAAAGLIIKLTFDAVSLLDQKFVETGNPGYLVGNLLVSLLGGVFAKKVLGKVLGGTIAKLAIPLTLLVSAVADVKTVVGSTDIDALSAKSLSLNVLSALKVGGAFGYLSYVSGGLTAGMSAGLGASAALMTLGVLIGLKATKDVVDTGEITKKTILSDILAAGAFGAGLFVSGLVLKAGTVGTLMAVGGAGAIALLGALLLIQAVVKLSKDDEAITWGNKTATETQIKDFVNNEMFSADFKMNLTGYSNSVALGEGEDDKITSQVEKLLPELYTLKLGVDTAASIENIRATIFDKGGLIDQYNNKYKSSIATVKATINLVPLKDSEGNDLSAEYFKGISSGWEHLNGVMQQLGKDLADEMVKANNAEMNSAARRIYENNVGVLTQVMIDINSAIASRHANSESQKTFREGVENWDWDQKSYSDLLKFYNEQKSDVDKQIESAYQTYYDELDDVITANEVMLRDAEKYGLSEIGGRTVEEIKSEIDEMNKLRAVLDENKEASIKAAKAYYESGAGYKLLHDAILDHLKTRLSQRDVEQMGNSKGATNRNAVRDYFINGAGEFEDIKETLEENIDQLLKQKLGNSYSTIKEMIDAGILSYTEFVDETFYDAMAKRYGITGDYEEAWKEFIDQYLHPKALEEVEEQAQETHYIEPPKVEVAGAETITQSVEENPAVKEAEEVSEEIKQISEEATGAKQNILALNDVQFDTKGVESSADAAASSIEDMARRIRDAFATLDGLSYEMDISGTKYSGAMRVLIPKIEQKASGGFVRSGDLVMANENGNFEMLGRMGNQPVVANNQQIVSGISQGVSQANSGVESRLGAIETMLTRILQKEFVARAVPSSGWGQHGVQSSDAWNKVTG